MFSPTEVLPTGEISKFIESYWETALEGETTFTPQGTFHVIYSTAPFTLIAEENHELDEGFYLLPINLKLIRILHKQKLIVVRAKAFTLDSIAERSNVFEIKHMDYWRFNSSVSILNHFKTNYKRFPHPYEYLPYLEELVCELLTNRFEINDDLRAQVNYILERKGGIQIKEMAKDFGVSRQSLHKYFIKHLGISPKELSQIWRINNFLDLANKKHSLTVSAIDSGFYDQAHSIRTFKTCFKLSPKEFLNGNFDYTFKCISNRFNNRYDPKV